MSCAGPERQRVGAGGCSQGRRAGRSAHAHLGAPAGVGAPACRPCPAARCAALCCPPAEQNPAVWQAGTGASVSPIASKLGPVGTAADRLARAPAGRSGILLHSASAAPPPPPPSPGRTAVCSQPRQKHAGQALALYRHRPAQDWQGPKSGSREQRAWCCRMPARLPAQPQ